MPPVSWQVKSKIHGAVNLTIIFCIFMLLASCLWHFLPTWWLWLLSLPLLGFVVMFIGDRAIPLLTNGLIERVFTTKLDSFESVPFQLKDPWKIIDSSLGAKLEEQLRKKLVRGHPLKGLQIKVIAEKADCSTVLLCTSNPSLPIAMVSMVSSAHNKEGSPFPPVKLFASWDKWRKKEFRNDPAHDSNNASSCPQGDTG